MPSRLARHGGATIWKAMRPIITGILLGALLGTSVSCSTELPAPAPRAEVTLDPLFDRLRATPSAHEAQMLEVAIRHAWSRSGEGTVDALMGRAVEAIHAGQYETALDTLDRVVRTAPRWAEGWNLRATVHYLREDYAEAVVDIEHVLSLEPRHFGALAGLGRIFLELEDKEAALQAFEAALSIHPHLEEIREEAETIREELAGTPI